MNLILSLILFSIIFVKWSYANTVYDIQSKLNTGEHLNVIFIANVMFVCNNAVLNSTQLNFHSFNTTQALEVFV
jgi:hypothetical protein